MPFSMADTTKTNGSNRVVLFESFRSVLKKVLGLLSRPQTWPVRQRLYGIIELELKRILAPWLVTWHLCQLLCNLLASISRR